jgi:nucleotide-binding universal stress UspA family protein
MMFALASALLFLETGIRGRVVADTGPDMITSVANTSSETLKTFTSILVDVDATATAQPALERAAEIARRCGAPLRVVDVMSAPAEARRALRADLEDELMRQRRERLARVAYRLRDVVVETDILAGMPADTLIADVERHGHDLLVRSHARDIAARGPKPFGPVDVQLFRRCPCTVWAVGAGACPMHPKVVGSIDVSTDAPVKRDLNRRVIEVAGLLARLQEGSLILMYAWQPFAEQRVAGQASDDEYSMYLDDTRRRAKQNLVMLAESFGNRLAGTQLELRRGSLKDVLPEFVVAEGIDIVVVGTMGRTGILRQLRGNTAEQLLDRLPCSVVAVKPAPNTSCTHTTSF